ncbi:hypothetical protein CXG81DRAFT_18168 [Caulochytrium protostelioides]|uniref:Uncharacterized protein n=1 Tax=Caulochytrium protostelioides TaxID=1555241 RepID=A0A4P9WYS2_9FUNG|nr:hypothetical protein CAUPRSCDRAFT_10891 [Caulochytrium protostelioides]RKP02127.1 hypothetical protein CXG81DRAFT_18168 [Caulochytrium protostelioides]|eukprot:RKP02127.1 hypothetical protein CXG81DRAFT_18168 [Caulochytrium protostelioides]
MGCGPSKEAQVAPTVETKQISSEAARPADQIVATSAPAVPAAQPQAASAAALPAAAAASATPAAASTGPLAKSQTQLAQAPAPQAAAAVKSIASLNAAVSTPAPAGAEASVSKPQATSVDGLVGKPVAFEIPVDDLMPRPKTGFRPPTSVRAPPAHAPPQLGALRGHIPKGEAANEERPMTSRRRGERPELTSSQYVRPLDSTELSEKLREREEQAAINRQRELERIKLQLAEKDERIRQVQERKRQLAESGQAEDANEANAEAEAEPQPEEAKETSDS